VAGAGAPAAGAAAAGALARIASMC
jgi:hypothetical protein